MNDPDLEPYLGRPMSPPDPALLATIERGPVDPSQTLPLAEIDRLLDPAPLPVETGWCFRSDRVGYVAVRTPMPAVSAEMVEWWFDWHAHDPDRYRLWHPLAHIGNSIEPPPVPGGEGPLGRRPPPGRGRRHRRGPRPHRLRAADRGRVLDRRSRTPGGGDDRLRLRRRRSAPAAALGDGTRLPGGARRRCAAQSLLARGGDTSLSAGADRSAGCAGAEQPRGPPLLPARGLPRGLAAHCAEEYTNLAALLPELYGRFGPAADSRPLGTRVRHHPRACPPLRSSPNGSSPRAWPGRLRAIASAVAERLLAVQGQDPRGARLAVRARSEGLTAADVDRALSEERSLLITWLNRGTLHLVRSEDYPWLHTLTTPPLLTSATRRLARRACRPMRRSVAWRRSSGRWPRRAR